jgi:RNA polymerase sigma-70 factor (ECF subfamily)
MRRETEIFAEAPAQRRAPAPQNAQLSSPDGVKDDVGSMAIPRGVPSGIRANVGGLSVNFSALSDAEVMLRARTGDDAAFDYLVEKYRRPLIGFMYRMARNAAVAEELAQEVFLRVYRSRSSYKASAKFTTWLYRIAANLVVNHLRDTKHERAENVTSIDDKDAETGLAIDVPDPALTAEQAILRRERLAAIQRHVQELPERQRLAVIMHKYQDLDYRQIGEVLGLSEPATKSLLFRAYETLRDRLKDFV